MICSMNPSVSRWVNASAAGVQREANTACPSNASKAPASTKYSGAVRKKRAGTATGGPCSKASKACI